MIFDPEFVKDCKSLEHEIGTCNGCGEPYCLTENICFAKVEIVEQTPELLAIKYRRELAKLQ